METLKVLDSELKRLHDLFKEMYLHSGYAKDDSLTGEDVWKKIEKLQHHILKVLELEIKLEEEGKNKDGEKK